MKKIEQAKKYLQTEPSDVEFKARINGSKLLLGTDMDEVKRRLTVKNTSLGQCPAIWEYYESGKWKSFSDCFEGEDCTDIIEGSFKEDKLGVNELVLNNRKYTIVFETMRKNNPTSGKSQRIRRRIPERVPDADQLVSLRAGLVQERTTEYLEKSVMDVVTKGLAEIALERPRDLHLWLGRYLLASVKDVQNKNGIICFYRGSREKVESERQRSSSFMLKTLLPDLHDAIQKLPVLKPDCPILWVAVSILRHSKNVEMIILPKNRYILCQGKNDSKQIEVYSNSKVDNSFLDGNSQQKLIHRMVECSFFGYPLSLQRSKSHSARIIQRYQRGKQVRDKFCT